MSTPQDAIAHSLAASRRMLEMYLNDLTPADFLYRTCTGGNCAAWIVGHLVLSERRALTAIGVKDLPALPEGFDKRFARDAEAPGKTDFGDTAILWPLFAKHRDLLIETVKKTPLEQLDEPLEKPHPMFKTAGEVANFMAAHAAMHAGQITLIRRGLGRPPVV